MLFTFDSFEIDCSQYEVRRNGQAIKTEPQVFALLAYLAEHHGRLITKEELVEKIWGGRAISDSALSSRIKSARQALSDTGKAQRYIKTVHGKGFRFMAHPAIQTATVNEPLPAQSGDSTVLSSQKESAPLTPPCIAVMPFSTPIAGMEDIALGHALSHDIITALSRLRWLKVIARGSTFRFQQTHQTTCDIAAALNADYILNGDIVPIGNKVELLIELTNHDGDVIWAERLAGSQDAIHEWREFIIAQTITALDIQIPLQEAGKARLQAPEDLTAWSHFHLGLQHMYRFNKGDNKTARHHFEQAVALAPHFARGHAGLSFVHFQDAFISYTDDRADAITKAIDTAQMSVELDRLDPFANFTMGRVYWLQDDISSSMQWLDNAIDLCPNYAQGLYARAWAGAVSDRDVSLLPDLDRALGLSPLDPLSYAMHATRALDYLRHDDPVSAAKWADRAAFWAAAAKQHHPTMSFKEFLKSFPFSSEKMVKQLGHALQQHGF